MSKGKKVGKIIITLILILAVIAGSFVYLLKWNSSYVVPQTKMSLELIDKLAGAQLKGETVNLSSGELNEIIGMYFKGIKASQPLSINGIKTEFLGEKLKLNIPCNYKGFNVFVSSEGKLNLKDDKIVYSPENIKVGKMSLPKDYIMKNIAKYNSNKIVVENNQILFNKNLIPLNIKDVQIKDSTLLLTIDKIDLKEKIKSLYTNLTSIYK